MSWILIAVVQMQMSQPALELTYQTKQECLLAVEKLEPFMKANINTDTQIFCVEDPMAKLDE